MSMRQVPITGKLTLVTAVCD